MKVIKRLLTKSRKKGEDPYLALLAYRDLQCKKSPAEILFYKKLKTSYLTLDNGKSSIKDIKSNSQTVQPLSIIPVANTIRVYSQGMDKPTWLMKAKVIEQPKFIFIIN